MDSQTCLPSAPPLSVWFVVSEGNCGFGFCRAFVVKLYYPPRSTPVIGTDGLNWVSGRIQTATFKQKIYRFLENFNNKNFYKFWL